MPKTPTPERLPSDLVPYTVPVGAALFEKTVAKIEEKHFKRVKIPVAITIQEAIISSISPGETARN